MITFKCKMCGGDLHPEENATTCECEYCGSVQTIPTADNEKKGNLFNRANRLRMAAEYDKAAAVYTSITAEFPEEAEAYWGLCLCKYGIEYVEDPVTAKKIPTCHRTRSESIMDDPDFDQACENADAVAKRVYREEAKAIDRLQQDILSVVANESPYDVFICYKETDDDGQRTEDSVLAQDIYDALTAKGLKVFFARITLEDKLGQQYEPYIYAALHSAKVMLVIGTQFEYFDAVWVKNEWSRFLDMMKSDKSKTLIPCYKDIDAYDMPREFKNLQAQDMGKLGWLQDLTRGVMKLCMKDKGKDNEFSAFQQVIQTGNPTTESLLARAFVFLEDGEWERAINYADKVLDIDVKNGRAYLAKLMAVLEVRHEETLKDQPDPFDNNELYHKIMRFGDEALKERVKSYAYVPVWKGLKDVSTIDQCMELKNKLESFKDVDGCVEKIGECDAKCELIKETESKIDAFRKLVEEKYNSLLQVYNDKMKVHNEAERELNAEKKRALEELQREYDNTRNSVLEAQSEPKNLHGVLFRKRKNDLNEKITMGRRKMESIVSNTSSLELRYKQSLANLPEIPTKPITPNKNEIIYECAKIYADAGLYYSAINEYKKIRGYKDVDEIIKELNIVDCVMSPVESGE